jgi:uncharacterized integral membrane protein
MNPLRDNLAHSYALEVEPHPTYEREPIIGTRADAFWVIVQTAACLFVIVALFAGLFLMGMGVEGPRP